MNPEIRFIGPVNSSYSSKIKYATIEECYEYCMAQSILGLDIETTKRYKNNMYRSNVYLPGLDPYLSSVVMLQIGTRERIYVIDTRTVDISILKDVLSNKNKLLVGHNLKFEQKHLLHNYGFLFWYIWDTMLVDQCLTNGLGKRKENPYGYSYSLEALSNRYLGTKSAVERDLFTEEGDEDLDTKIIDKSTRMGFLSIGDKPFTETQILYGADDIVLPLEIREHQLLGYRGYYPEVLINLENEFCLVLADIELKGMPFDQEQWLKTYEANLIVFARRKEKLDRWVEENYKQFCLPPDMFRSTYTCNVQWTSSKQVVELFRHIGFCPKEISKTTKKLEYTVTAGVLTKLLDGNYKEKYMSDQETEIVTQQDIILNYLLLKVSEQCITTFGKDWLKNIHPITGKTHSSYRQILNTGRSSSSNPNLQNVPSDIEYRKAFVASQGNVLINSDYASQEARIVADVSGDESMLKFFNEGDPVHGSDYHSMTGTKLFRVLRNDPNLLITKKTHPKERNDAKSLSFKIIYGGSAMTLKDDLDVSKEEAQKFIDAYLDAFPGLKRYFKESHAAAIEKGYIDIDIITGRRYWESEWEEMLELNEKILSYYPANYKKLPYEEKKVVKDKIKEDYPEFAEILKKHSMIMGSLKRCAQNYRIQGLAGSQTKTFAVMFRRYQIENNLRDIIWLINLIHDECLAEVLDDDRYKEMGRKLIEDLMVAGASVYCKSVKMGAEAGITPFWFH